MKKQFIFIAYFFYPNREVGANRIRFWVEYLKRDFPEIEPVVITATPFKEDEKITDQQFYVEEGNAGPLGLFIKDEGLRWKDPLKAFFLTHTFENVIGSVITGGPFMQFSVIDTVKLTTRAPVAIDFRDPFAFNERFHNSWVKMQIKSFFERGFVKKADRVICVNRDFFQTLSGYSPDEKKFRVIPNGFDEISIEAARKEVEKKERGDGPLKLILTGKYYRDASPLPLFQAMKMLREEGFPSEFQHYGSSEVPDFIQPDREYIHEMGIRDYKELARSLVMSHVGVLLIAGVDQNTPTKVFDYMGAELPLLIITSGRLQSGNAHEVTKDYTMVKWCKNDIIEIMEALRFFFRENIRLSYPDRLKFSRRHGLKALLEAFEQ